MFGSALWVAGGIVGMVVWVLVLGLYFIWWLLDFLFLCIIHHLYAVKICCMGGNWGVPTGWKSPN